MRWQVEVTFAHARAHLDGDARQDSQPWGGPLGEWPSLRQAACKSQWPGVAAGWGRWKASEGALPSKRLVACLSVPDRRHSLWYDGSREVTVAVTIPSDKPRWASRSWPWQARYACGENRRVSGNGGTMLPRETLAESDIML
jgi:hypothetical protein